MKRTTALCCFFGAALLNIGAATAATTMNVKAMPLGEVLRVTEATTGVTFVIDPCITRDTVTRTIPTIPTPMALADLLDGYNYGAVWDDRGKLVRVIVSGRISGPDPACTAATQPSGAQDSPGFHEPHQELFRYQPMPAAIPDRYRDMAPGLVNPVSLPIEEMTRMELGDQLDMSLPDGQFGVILENRFEHDNGDVTWVGYLEGADSSDRVIITGGSEGSVGQVITPEGTYSIEFEEGQSWLVDTGRRDLQATMDQASNDDSLQP